ncbi:MAG: TIGR04255 family protein [Chlamydiales bacterium]
MPNLKSEKIKKNQIPILLHPPILEAIFEVRWEIENDPQNGRMRDPSYPMMYGRLYERLKKDFPVIEDLPSVQAHPEMTPFVPRHRMRKDKNGYPLIQVGPGILTVNDAKGYSWNHFSSLALRAVESLVELFPVQSLPLNFTKGELRYVNGIRFDIARENPLSFLAEKLHMKIEMDPELFELNRLNERPNAVGLNLSYVLEKPVANLAIAANLGQFEGKPAFIQQTLIQSFGEMTPPDVEGFTLWLEEAHTAAENCFQVFCKGALMEKFCGA